ncbi:H-NS family nucleoid-associated regulatory protein [Xanthomonas axonopodis]
MATVTEIEKKKQAALAELAKIEAELEKLKSAEASKNFEDIHGKLEAYFEHFSDEQKSKLKAFFPAEKVRKARGPNKPKGEKAERSQVEPKYQLPTGETWSGRGRPPVAFTAWKKANPDHEFPAIPKSK